LPDRIVYNEHVPHVIAKKSSPECDAKFLKMAVMTNITNPNHGHRLIGHDAIHEAGHVVTALCYRFKVVEVFVKPHGILATRTTFDPAKTMPYLVYGMKIAGAVAVEIHNEKYGTTDDNGFGVGDDPASDAALTAKVTTYLRAIDPTPTHLAKFEAQMRTMVRRKLCEHWTSVEVLAQEIERLTPSGVPLRASRIGEVICLANRAFYERIKDNLVAN